MLKRSPRHLYPEISASSGVWAGWPPAAPSLPAGPCAQGGGSRGRLARCSRPRSPAPLSRGWGRALGPPPTAGDAETFFFTFPQCHDFRFPPSERKKKKIKKKIPRPTPYPEPEPAPSPSPARAQPEPSPAPARARRGHGGPRVRGDRTSAGTELAASPPGVPALPQGAAAARRVGKDGTPGLREPPRAAGTRAGSAGPTRPGPLPMRLRGEGAAAEGKTGGKQPKANGGNN